MNPRHTGVSERDTSGYTEHTPVGSLTLEDSWMPSSC